MGAPLPRFVRRLLLLSRARAAFAADQLEKALETTAAAELEADPEARGLREAVLERLVRRAVQEHAAEGASPALDLLARHAPERALSLKRELEAAEVRTDAPAPPSSRTTLQSLLAELRGRSTAPAAGVPRSAKGTDEGGASSPSLPPRGRLFHLAVDDAGDFLVAAGARFVIGNLRSRDADLAFLADVEREHAELRLSASFHAGERWRIVPLTTARPVLVRGVAIGPEGVELAHGDHVVLARNLAFHFVATEPASSSAVLELEHGAECHGAIRVLLLAAGVSGRVRIGKKRRRLLVVPDLVEEVALELGDHELVVACVGGLRSGTTVVEPAPDARIVLPCPPVVRVDLLVGARARPPFMLLLGPLANDGGGARP